MKKGFLLLIIILFSFTFIFSQQRTAYKWRVEARKPSSCEVSANAIDVVFVQEDGKFYYCVDGIYEQQNLLWAISTSYVPRMNSAGSLVNSTIQDDGTDALATTNFRIGNPSYNASYLLQIQKSSWTPTSNARMINILATFSQQQHFWGIGLDLTRLSSGSTTTQALNGIVLTLTNQSSVNNQAGNNGMSINNNNSGTLNIGGQTGYQVTNTNTGSLAAQNGFVSTIFESTNGTSTSTQRGFWSRWFSNSTGNTSEFRAFDASGNIKTGSGTLTNLYAFYVGSDFDVTATNKWAFYSLSTAKSKFSGQVEITGGVKINTGSKPTCDVNERFTIWTVAGGAGVKDTVEVCAKDNANNYAWRTIY